MPDAPFRPRLFARKFPFVVPRCYVLGKVLTDPLYAAVWEVLRPTREPLLDVGCGMGVMSFYLRERGWDHPCTGLDVDPAKIAIGEKVKHRFSGECHFQVGDAAQSLPEHRGSVTVLDVLQYLPHERQRTLLTHAASRVSPNGLLIIRNTFAEDRKRYGFTVFMDWLARWLRWMGTPPQDYPKAESIRKILAAQGLHGEFQPLWGRTPFHNWLGVFRRKA